MLKFFRKLVCGVVSLQMVLIGIPARAAEAPPVDCSNLSLGSIGTSLNQLCAVAQVGTKSVSYPVLTWDTAASSPYKAIVPADATNYVTSLKSSMEVRGGFEASLLDVSPKEAVALATLLPSNTPWVVGRYTPETAELRIDIYRVERSGDNVAIMVAPFTPAHGDYWKASGAYITAAQRANNVEGKNPFAAFKDTSDGNFHNISFGAARVALGHAVRMAQAPVGVMAFVYTDLKHKTKKSGTFRKKYTTKYWGRAVTKWYVGYPMDFGATASALAEEAYCVTDPSQANCPTQEVARSSLAFEEFSGGTMEDGSPTDAYGNKKATGELVYYDKDVKKGWGFLAILAISFVFTFGASTLLTFAGGLAQGLTASAALDTALAGVGAAAQSAAYSTAYSAGFGVANGADLGTPVSKDSLGFVTVDTGVSKPSSIDWDNHYGKAVRRATTKTLLPDVDAIPASEDPDDPASTSTTLSSMRSTLVGNCALSNGAKDCGVSSGVLVRRDQMATTNLLRVWKEGDKPVRSYDALPAAYGGN